MGKLHLWLFGRRDSSGAIMKIILPHYHLPRPPRHTRRKCKKLMNITKKLSIGLQMQKHHTHKNIYEGLK